MEFHTHGTTNDKSEHAKQHKAKVSRPQRMYALILEVKMGFPPLCQQAPVTKLPDVPFATPTFASDAQLITPFTHEAHASLKSR